MGEPKAGKGGIVFLAVGFLAVIAATGFILLGGQVSKTLGRPGGPGLPMPIYETVGDWDVACSTTTPGGNPAGCSTPLPTLEPAAVAAAKPLELAALDVPVTRTGPMQVDLGEATLANGVLHETSFHLDGIGVGEQVLPPGLHVQGTIRLALVSTDPSRPPFGNGYARGWHPGVEVVKARLLLDVTGFDPGMVLKIRDVVVK